LLGIFTGFGILSLGFGKGSGVMELGRIFLRLQ
jgi:hypothetical protein